MWLGVWLMRPGTGFKQRYYLIHVLKVVSSEQKTTKESEAILISKGIMS
jgi:hypothetical protein